MDTSIVVAALTNEARTAEVQDWLADQQAGELAISDWVMTEFSAALSMKLRSGQLQPPERAEALAVFTELVEASFHVLSVTGTDFRVAARFADQHPTGLRAGDALHLAVAASHGARIRALDKSLVAASEALGVSASLI
ncbi:MAG: PIN domain-containing protein [Gammaproteobacteria bacterium]|nr:MAG: PIN domain-containing protein [Gammaproteobacteria bacterium]